MTSLAGGLHWVGLFLVAVAGLFVWATWRRMGESENPAIDVVALVWTALGLTGFLLVAVIFQDDGKQSAGWLALAAHGAGLYALARWTPRFQHAAALARFCRWARSLCGGARHRRGNGLGCRPIRLGRDPVGRLLCRGGLRAAVERGPAGLLGGSLRRRRFTHFLLSWYVLRSVAIGTPWGLVSIGLAVPFLVGAERLARWRQSMPGATEALGFMAAGVTLFIAAAIPSSSA